jgi:sigma-B regulation protein RsbU (phosphoserine phosphatase)
MRLINDIIAQIPLFSTLPFKEIAYLGKTLHVREFPAKAVLFQEGQSDDCCYLIIEGQVEIVKALGSSGERFLGFREKDSLLGEMSLFSKEGKHTASVRALTPVRSLEITRKNIDELLHRWPLFAYELTRTLSQRLEQSENLTILELQEKNRQLTQAYEDLKAAQAQIIEKERLEKELEVARQIQQSILPQELPGLPRYEFGALMIPARAVGGDFYDFIPLDQNRMAIVVGDVSDKGIPSALFMALCYSLVRAEAHRSATPGETLLAVNRLLLEMNTADMFVTVLYGVLDCSRGEFSFARAGHPQPIILDSRGELQEPGYNPGQVLGLFDQPLLDEQSLVLPNGGVMLVYSDGLTEATNPSGDDFKDMRLYRVLPGLIDQPAQLLCESLWDETMAFCLPNLQQDDFTLVCVKIF